MNPSLRTELRALFADNARALYLLSLAASIGPQWEDHRRDAANSLSEILPAKPAKCKFAPDSFWSKFCQKQVWPTAFHGTEQQQEIRAAWLRRERERATDKGLAWPPPVRTSRATGHPPQVRTGKE